MNVSWSFTHRGSAGTVDLEFRIFDAETLGNQVDMNGDGMVDALDTTQVFGVSVTDGILSTKFGLLLIP